MGHLGLQAADAAAVARAGPPHKGVAQFAGITGQPFEQAAGDHEAGADAARAAVDIDEVFGAVMVAEQMLGDRPGVGIVGCVHRQFRCGAEHRADIGVMPIEIGCELNGRLPAVYQTGDRDPHGGDGLRVAQRAADLGKRVHDDCHRVLGRGHPVSGTAQHSQDCAAHAHQADGDRVDFRCHCRGQHLVSRAHDRTRPAHLRR